MKVIGLIIPSLNIGYLIVGEYPTREYASVTTIAATSIEDLTSEYEDHVDHFYRVRGTGINRDIQNVGAILLKAGEYE